MWFDPGFGYHVDKTTGIATGNDPESIYAVMSGTHFNGVSRRAKAAAFGARPHDLTPPSLPPPPPAPGLLLRLR